MLSRHGLVSIAFTFLLLACGTTGNIQPSAPPQPAAATPTPKGAPAVDLTAYDTVVVLDFTDATDKSKVKPVDVQAYTATVASATRSFADLIAAKVRASGAFQEVTRTATTGKALSVSGRITRLTEGSGALRFWVGMGAGSSYFEVTTELTDAQNGASLGTIRTDKNSWALGGAIASSQTVQSFMEGASDKIATELRDSKQGRPAPKKN